MPSTGYAQWKYESIPGNESNTPTLSTKVLYTPHIEAGPNEGIEHLNRDDETRGLGEPLPVLPETYTPEWSLEQRIYPDALGFFLKLMFGEPTTATGNGVITDQDSVAIPTGAYRHRWDTSTWSSGLTPKTAQAIFAYADQGLFIKHKGVACSQMQLTNPDTGGSRMSLEGPSLFGSEIANPSLTPAYESTAIRPFMHGDLSLPTWLTNTGTTSEFEMTFTNPVEAIRSFAIASLSPDSMERANDLPTISGSIGKRNIDPDDQAALRNATSFAATARYVSRSMIASAYPYKFYVVMSNAQYVEGEVDALTNSRHIGGSFNFKASAAGSAAAVLELVNATASYA
jgi:hypothetical protein